MANKAKSVNKTLVTTLLIVQFPVYPLFVAEYLPPSQYSSRLSVPWLCRWFSKNCRESAEMSKTWFKVYTPEGTYNCLLH